MNDRIPHFVAALALAAPALSQIGTDGFEAGNVDGWEIWFSAYNTVQTSGGNPNSYLELDNVTSGPATCHFVRMFPGGTTGATTFAHSGNWRAAGVNEVSVDLDIQQGIFGGDVEVVLISDPGTPANTSDDCAISFRLPGVGASTPGWQTYTFDVPTADTAAPPGWQVVTGSVCTASTLDVTWNTVVQDVDRIEFEYDGNPLAFCAFTSWIFGMDNVTVSTGGPVTIGTNYCMANANSTGVPAGTSATGSAVAAADSVTLHCGAMPAQAFGYFLTSRMTGFVPNPQGSAGNLCLGGSIGRFVGPGQIVNSGASGEISLVLDLSQHPTPTGFVQVVAGDTWHFTAWFRDAGAMGPTSNFADGLTIAFV